jgi:DNA recombination protein RmuC
VPLTPIVAATPLPAAGALALAALLGVAVALALVAGARRSDWSSAAGEHHATTVDPTEADLVGSLRAELQRIERGVHALGRASAEQYGRLDQAVHDQARATQQLAGVAHGLHRALADPGARGQWGERMVDDVLRLAGFIEHVNYERRRAVQGDGPGDARGIPDITFHLPRGRALYLDVKFPIAAYLRLQAATSAAERDAHRAQFLRDVRDRVRELARRDYHLTAGVDAVDHVLLFLPNEAIFAFLFEHDPALVDDSLRQRVVLCSPLTLYSHLVVIRQAVEQHAVEQTSDRLLDLLARFDDQWTRYCASLEVVRRRFDSVHRELEQVVGPRRQALDRPLREIRALRDQRGVDATDLDGEGAESIRCPS